jgi:hypothetical protein
MPQSRHRAFLLNVKPRLAHGNSQRPGFACSCTAIIVGQQCRGIRQLTRCGRIVCALRHTWVNLTAQSVSFKVLSATVSRIAISFSIFAKANFMVALLPSPHVAEQGAAPPKPKQVFTSNPLPDVNRGTGFLSVIGQRNSAKPAKPKRRQLGSTRVAAAGASIDGTLALRLVTLVAYQLRSPASQINSF